MPFGLPDSQQRLSYGGYLKIAELTSLQQQQSDPPHHDEMLFIIIHQAYELWFKQMLHEIDAAIQRLDSDDVLGTCRVLRRCFEIERLLVAQIGVLETMTPMDFLAFRDHLFPASGFQSSQFRELEFVSGLKDPRFLEYYAAGSPERARLEQRLAARTLPEAFHDLLRRRGLDVPDGEGEEAREVRLQSLARIYREPETYYDLFLLAEGLIEYDETFLTWRMRHVHMVERIIGGRPGTGGSEGAQYLRSTTDRRFFPDLWDLRNVLGLPPSIGHGKM
ncbi:MAG TPA: tryptophan 2,3-dioxygenase family protein [Thermoanaerobaculia bacterium]|nr:tryptophan 2,3-dioxygenase family protein [Thermoanaerobaculia bacterium]